MLVNSFNEASIKLIITPNNNYRPIPNEQDAKLLMLWPLVGFPCSSGWPHTSVLMGNTNWTYIKLVMVGLEKIWEGGFLREMKEHYIIDLLIKFMQSILIYKHLT